MGLRIFKNKVTIIPYLLKANTWQCGEMVDTPDSKSGIEICGGSSPPTGTTSIFKSVQTNLKNR